MLHYLIGAKKVKIGGPGGDRTRDRAIMSPVKDTSGGFC